MQSSSESDNVVASTVSGNTVSLNANNNVNVAGSHIVSKAETNINADNNVNIESVQTNSSSQNFYEKKRSGVLSTNGLAISIGKREQQNKNNEAIITNTASTVGSTDGNVNIRAGNNYQQTASNVVAPEGDVNITAKEININAAQDSIDEQRDTLIKKVEKQLQCTVNKTKLFLVRWSLN